MSFAFFLFTIKYAQMVKLVYTLVSGTSGRKAVQVRVLFWAPTDFPHYFELCADGEIGRHATLRG